MTAEPTHRDAQPNEDREEGTRDPGRRATEDFLRRCGFDGDTLRDGLEPASGPLASLASGAAGIGYAMYRLSHATGDATLLRCAGAWTDRAVALSARPDAFLSELPSSLFHSQTGVHALAALVALAEGRADDARLAVASYVAASRAPCEPLDLTLGKAGLLLGCAELFEAARAARTDPTPIAERGTELATEIRDLVHRSSFATSPAVTYLGLAHGWAGILFALLRWSQATDTPAAELRPKLDELAALHEPCRGGVRWPDENRTVEPRVYLASWCHGLAGQAIFWALAHEVLGAVEHLRLAEGSAELAWAVDVDHGTICCGLAGVGYACAALHRVTGSDTWLARARLSSRFAFDDRSPSFQRDSLYNGAVGAILLREELAAGRPATPLVERR